MEDIVIKETTKQQNIIIIRKLDGTETTLNIYKRSLYDHIQLMKDHFNTPLQLVGDNDIQGSYIYTFQEISNGK